MVIRRLQFILTACLTVVHSAKPAKGEDAPPVIPTGIYIPTGIQPLLPRPSTVALFRKGEVDHQGRLVSYRLFVPNCDRGKVPLVIWLHGHGDLEMKVEDGQLNYVEYILNADNAKNSRFGLLAMQCPTATGWFEGDDDLIDVHAALIDELCNQHPIDRDRITLVGISSGATASWVFAKRYQDLIAGIAPLAGGPVDTFEFDKISDLPVWAFHSARDKDADVGHSIRTIRAFNKAGGDGQLTLVDSMSHDCWAPAFNEFHLVDWLIQQKLGEPPKWGIAARCRILFQGWTTSQLLLQFGAPVLLLLIGVAHVTRSQIARRRLSSDKKGEQQNCNTNQPGNQ